MLWWALRQLRSSNAETRKYAVRNLGESGNAKAVSPLIAALNDAEPLVSSEALKALRNLLGTIVDVQATEALVAALKVSDFWVQSSATDLLVKIGVDAVEPLIAALIDDNPDFRNHAAQALGKIRDTRAVEPLIALLEDKNMGYFVEMALGDIGDKRAVEPLIAKLKRQNYGDPHTFDELAKIGGPRVIEFLVRECAANALTKVDDKQAVVESLITALKDNSESVRAHAAEALGLIGDEKAVESLISVLMDERYVVRRYAALALGAMGDRRIGKAFIALLKTGKYVAEQCVERTLKEIEDNQNVESLIAALNIEASNTLLKSDDPNIRESTAEVLSEIREPRAAELLVTVLNDSVYKVQRTAADSLAKIGNAAVEPLIAALKDEGYKVRCYVVEALGEIRDKRAVQPLITALKDESSAVRREAAEALGRIGDEQAVEPLIAALKDEEYAVRKLAVVALGAIGDTRACEPLNSGFEHRRLSIEEVAEALSAIGCGQLLATLIAGLKQDAWTQKLAAQMLGKIGDERAVEPLIAALKEVNAFNDREEKIYKPGSPTGDPMLGKEFAESLCKVLEGSARKVATNALVTMSDTRFEYWDCVDDYYGILRKRELDLSYLRGLARQELKRRGVGA